MKFHARTIAGFLIAPASFGILAILLSFLSSHDTGLVEGLWVLKFSAAIGYPVTLVIGLPLFLLMMEKGFVSASAYAIVAALFSALLIAYFVLWPMAAGEGGGFSQLFSPPRVGQISIIAFGCFFVVFVFWLIARPDKQLPSHS